MFEEAQITPRVVLETENIETVMALAIKGMGITFYPRMFISGSEAFSDQMRQGGHHLLLPQFPRARGVLGIGYHKGHYMSQASREFIRIAKETI